jgi:hypothetical protein
MAKVTLNKGDINRTIGVGNTTLVKGDFSRILSIGVATAAPTPPSPLPGVSYINGIAVANLDNINKVLLADIDSINGVS